MIPGPQIPTGLKLALPGSTRGEELTLEGYERRCHGSTRGEERTLGVYERRCHGSIRGEVPTQGHR